MGLGWALTGIAENFRRLYARIYHNFPKTPFALALMEMIWTSGSIAFPAQMGGFRTFRPEHESRNFLARSSKRLLTTGVIA